MMMEIRRNILFTDATFRKCFDDLFSVSEGLLAPLSYITRNFPLAVGKGGALYLTRTGKDVPDMSYLVHVLNACIIGGRMFEKDVISRKKESKLLEKQIRLFFSAMVLHDINKLFTPNETEAAQRLDRVFDTSKDRIIKMVGGYLDLIGPPENWLNDLKYLIMITEERTRELAGSVKTSFNRQELEEIGRYLKLGDQVSSGTGGTDSLELFLHVKEKFASFDLYRGEEYASSLHFIKLPNIPQTLLRLKFIDVLTEELLPRDGSRNIIIRTPDSIIYYGNPIDSTFIGTLTDKYRKAVYGANDVENNQIRILKSYPPGSNKISFEWARYLKPSQNTLDKYIELFYNRVLLWSKESWRSSHPDFPSLCFSKWGIEIESSSNSPPRFSVKRYDDAADDPDILDKKILVKIAAAKRILLELALSSNKIPSSEISALVADADAIQRKTVEALAYAGSWRDKSNEERVKEYNSLLEELGRLIEGKYPLREDTSSEEVRYLLGQTLPDPEDPSLRVPDKRYACIQCGRYSKETLKEDRAFGFNPTAGGGRKLTRLVYSDDLNGRICNLCRTENRLRKEEFKDTLKQNKAALAVQIFLGDFITPVDISQIILSLNEDIRSEIDDNLTLKLSEREKMQINYHALGFISRPHGSENVPQISSEFYLLRRLLELISGTGFKIHITPLFNSERILNPIFTWENSPGWVKELHWDSIRIDQVEDTLKEIKFLYDVAKIGRGTKDLPDVIAARLRGPGGLLRKMWEYNVRSGKKNLLIRSKEVKEEFGRFCMIHAELLNMKEIERMVEAVSKMVYKPPETNNDDRWAIQRAFEVYERGVAE
ncbi:MAG: hypothetical protein QXU18_14240, partial [Thermoplasmatales archaeon]